MKNPRFDTIKPNYRKGVLDIFLKEGRKRARYSLPFAALRGVKITSGNRIVEIKLDQELDNQGANLLLMDGSRTNFPADYVLYYCDPDYAWSPINQLKRGLRNKLQGSRLSVRVIADALQTSPSQVARLLQENHASKQLVQIFQLAELAGYKIEFRLTKKAA